MSRNYYCLVAGLPDISLEDGKLSFTLQEFIEELKEFLHPADINLIEMMFLKHDNFNLLNILEKNEVPFQKGGKFSKEELEEQIKESTTLPSYMQEFITAFQEDKKIIEGMSRENELASLYTDYLLSSKNNFLKEWFELEVNIKNILSALTCKKHDMPLKKEIIGTNTVSDLLKKNTTDDFGLQGELEYMDNLIRIFDDKNLAEREKNIDLLKLDILEERSFFNYFSIEKIIAFVVKLSLVERWLVLDRKTGEEMFNKLLKNLETSYEFPEEFRR